jgi:hypothetical protein
VFGWFTRIRLRFTIEESKSEHIMVTLKLRFCVSSIRVLGVSRQLH